jgi:hypothetical protein
LLIYFFLNLFPVIIFKIYNNLNLRHSYEGKIFLLDFINISIKQNVNGQARILFILQLLFLLLFKKYNSQKKFIANIFFYTSAVLIFLICLMQSRFIIILLCIFNFFIIICNYNLNFKKKLFYLFFLIITITYATNLSKSERFSNLGVEEKRFLNDKINNFNIYDEQYLYNERYLLNQCSVNEIVNKIDAFLTGRLCGWEILVKNLDNDLLFGKGFLTDQLLLKSVQKLSSNSWINLLFNAGILSLIIILLFITIVLLKYFKIKDINHKNIYICFSYYLVIFILSRSLLEDTIVFLNIDLIILIISLLIIKNSNKKNYNIKTNNFK